MLDHLSISSKEGFTSAASRCKVGHMQPTVELALNDDLTRENHSQDVAAAKARARSPDSLKLLIKPDSQQFGGIDEISKIDIPCRINSSIPIPHEHLLWKPMNEVDAWKRMEKIVKFPKCSLMNINFCDLRPGKVSCLTSKPISRLIPYLLSTATDSLKEVISNVSAEQVNLFVCFQGVTEYLLYQRNQLIVKFEDVDKDIRLIQQEIDLGRKRARNLQSSIQKILNEIQ